MKLQKTVLAITLLSSLTSFAEKQGKEGGGGTQIESAFRIRAYELIGKIKNNSAAEKMCSSKDLQAALESSDIRVVDRLVDLNTGAPVEGRNLDAWSKPGVIQLLDSAWKKYLPEDNKFGSSVDALILHEMYRTTTDCNDHRGEISSKVTALLSRKTETASSSRQYSRTFVFTTPTQKSGWGLHRWLNDKTNAYCVLIPPSGTANVLSVQTCPNGDLPDRSIPPLVHTRVDEKVVSAIYNMTQYTSADQPFYVVVDLKTGTVAYGVDPSHLNRIP